MICDHVKEFERYDMAEYNKLTQRLLAEGYTAENFPRDKVHIPSGCCAKDKNPLDNIYGGFEYNQIYRDSFIYKTGCGVHVIGRNVLSSMGFACEEWCHENDNPVVRCPYGKQNCTMNDKRLYGMCWCVCHKVGEPYNYEHSFEKAEKEKKKEKARKYKEYSEAHNGRVCHIHMIYNEHIREWNMIYEPRLCAKMCPSQNGYCPILGRELSKKRGNVYYDLKRSSVVKQQEPSLFGADSWTHIEKGIRFFSKPCSLDICEAFVKMQSEEILRHYMINHSSDFMFDKNLKVEILNIRAEARPSRDLMQDLQDIKNGITIAHASDVEKREKERKKEKRNQTRLKKIEKLEKKLLEVGYENLEPHSLDRVHADKWLKKERIEELEQIRRQKKSFKQLNLFDISI